MSNKDIWPEMLSLFCLLALSSIRSEIANLAFLVPSKQSSAPAFMRFSRLRLFKSEHNRLTKSAMDLYLPFKFLSVTIRWIIGLPRAFISFNAKLIAPLSASKYSPDSFTFGSLSSMPICWHEYIYPATLSVLSITDVIRAAINSTG